MNGKHLRSCANSGVHTAFNFLSFSYNSLTSHLNIDLWDIEIGLLLASKRSITILKVTSTCYQLVVAENDPEIP